jgi:hypothetical protein
MLYYAMTSDPDSPLRSYGDPTPDDALEALCKILENPEAAKPQRFTSFHVAQYRHTKAIMAHCAKLRRQAVKQQDSKIPSVKYEPLNEPWSLVRLGLPSSGSWPGPPVPVGSSEFYRIALQEVFWDLGPIPNDALEACVASWNKPHEGALAVLAARTKLSPTWVEKRLYTTKQRHKP